MLRPLGGPEICKDTFNGAGGDDEGDGETDDETEGVQIHTLRCPW